MLALSKEAIVAGDKASFCGLGEGHVGSIRWPEALLDQLFRPLPGSHQVKRDTLSQFSSIDTRCSRSVESSMAPISIS